MPVSMNGVLLARAARERRSKFEVLLTTGYAEASLERTDAGGSEFEVSMETVPPVRPRAPRLAHPRRTDKGGMMPPSHRASYAGT